MSFRRRAFEARGLGALGMWARFKAWFKAWREERRHNRVVCEYVKAGLSYGEVLSYQPMGGVDVMEAVDVMEVAFKRVEAEYVALGYKPVPLEAFVRSGGYGKNDVWLHLCRDSKQ